MLLQVDGWYGSGKLLIMSLLDSHPDVFCSPIHDFTFCAFMDQDENHEWVTTKHIKILRSAITRTRYSFFEQNYREGAIAFEFSADKRIYFPYNVDYYAFDRLWIDKLWEMEKWTFNAMTNALYESIWESHFKVRQDQNPPKWFASMGHAKYIDFYHRIPSLFPGAKSITIKRNVENIIATRCNRKIRPEDFTQKVHKFSAPFETRIYEDNEVENILNYYYTYEQLASKYPKIFMIADFDDFIQDTENIMRKIADFMEIPFHPSLLQPSLMCQPIVHNGKSYIDQEYDDINQLLTPEELEIIRNRKQAFYASKSND
jgi:hypothetical protein